MTTKNGPVKTSRTFTAPNGLELVVSQEGRKVGLEFTLAEKPQPSSTGKNLLHASTGGYMPIINGMRLSLLVIGPKGGK